MLIIDYYEVRYTLSYHMVSYLM